MLDFLFTKLKLETSAHNVQGLSVIKAPHYFPPGLSEFKYLVQSLPLSFCQSSGKTMPPSSTPPSNPLGVHTKKSLNIEWYDITKVSGDPLIQLILLSRD